MAGLSSADIFSILEKEIEKNCSDEQGKKEEAVENNVQQDGKVILQNNSDTGSIVRSSDSGKAEVPGNDTSSPGKVIEHDFSKNDSKTSEELGETETDTVAPSPSNEVKAQEPSPGNLENRGAKMKKNLRIRQEGNQIKVRVFVEDEELCGMALSKESGNSISLAGVKLYIEGEETVLEV